MKAINPERSPNVTGVFRRLKRLYCLEKAIIETGAPYRNFLRDEFESIVEESNLGWDEVEAAIDEWEKETD
jgi:hypothetical protein